MIRHLKMKLSFLTLILISSIVFATDEITISKAFIKMPRPGVDVTAGFATIKADIDLKVMKVSNNLQRLVEIRENMINTKLDKTTK